MNLSSVDPKIEIFCDFRVFFLRIILKNKNLEITEILQKGNAAQKTSNLKNGSETLGILK